MAALGIRAAAVIGVVLLAEAAGAQVTDTTRRAAPDTARRQVRDSIPRDSVRPPISPPRAFLYSLALPGLGQSRLQRHAAGAIYVTVEAIALGMTAKAANDLRIARQHSRDVIVTRYKTDPTTGAPVLDAQGKFVPADTVANRYTDARVKARRTHLEDWIAALIFNHLFAGADAFVAAHLWDLPAHVGFRATPGRASIGLTARW